MKQKLALVLSAFLVITLVAGLISNYIATDTLLRAFRSTEKIDKVEMEISSDNGLNKIVIIDRNQLDSIDNALKLAQEIDVQQGGLSEVWADINLYKKGQKLNFRIHHSKYNGWMINVGSKTFSSPYLFQLVSFYDNQ